MSKAELLGKLVLIRHESNWINSFYSLKGSEIIRATMHCLERQIYSSCLTHPPLFRVQQREGETIKKKTVQISQRNEFAFVTV